MSTVIHIMPVGHATKRTTMIGIEDDGRVRTRVEDPVGTSTDRQFNFSNLVEGDSREISTEPVTRVRAEKIGEDARFIIAVNEFYDSGLRGADAPQERFLWYPYTTKADEAPDSQAPQSATPSSPIYVVWSSAGTPASPTVPYSFGTAVGAPRLYAELVNTEGRRNHLKQLIRDMLEHPNMPQWLAGGRFDAHGDASGVLMHLEAIQTLSYYPEMLTRATAIDANLATERKFNLLDGMAKLDLGELHSVIAGEGPATRYLARNVASSDGNGANPVTTPDQWSFQRIGDVPNAAPYRYTRSNYTLTADRSLITMAGSVTVIGSGGDWQAWLRS